MLNCGTHGGNLSLLDRNPIPASIFVAHVFPLKPCNRPTAHEMWIQVYQLEQTSARTIRTSTTHRVHPTPHHWLSFQYSKITLPPPPSIRVLSVRRHKSKRVRSTCFRPVVLIASRAPASQHKQQLFPCPHAILGTSTDFGGRETSCLEGFQKTHQHKRNPCSPRAIVLEES